MKRVTAWPPTSSSIISKATTLCHLNRAHELGLEHGFGILAANDDANFPESDRKGLLSLAGYPALPIDDFKVGIGESIFMLIFLVT